MVALNPSFFDHILAHSTDIAIGVSGGADSMALLHLLSTWRQGLGENGPALHALIVDHGLRDESAAEAASVQQQIRLWPYVTPHILTWHPAVKPTHKIQELARLARHTLLTQFCQDHAIATLCLAHHLDDQCETVLMRLAAGSGVDGLGGMQDLALALHTSQVTIARPLLDAGHADLVSYCRAHKIEWVEDPSNQNPTYARIRLRQAQAVLSREGLTPDRVAQTAKRLQRARRALDWMVDQYWNSHAQVNGQEISLNLPALKLCPLEIQLRILMRAIAAIAPARPYPVRLEAAERLIPDFLARGRASSLAFGGCLMRIKPLQGQIIMMAEA